MQVYLHILVFFQILYKKHNKRVSFSAMRLSVQIFLPAFYIKCNISINSVIYL